MQLYIARPCSSFIPGHASRLNDCLMLAAAAVAAFLDRQDSGSYLAVSCISQRPQPVRTPEWLPEVHDGVQGRMS
ncbi:hypothetical protein BV20DRAFT_974528 [Pilatotrama ljubarskyi]|nr:hypothetical protein BV20DRAFT_974528 [Pilatotrama ljubarskyi]